MTKCILILGLALALAGCGPQGGGTDTGGQSSGTMSNAPASSTDTNASTSKP